MASYGKGKKQMVYKGKRKARFTQLGGKLTKISMSESQAWAKISAYVAENRINMALEASLFQENMAVEATDQNNGKLVPEMQKLDCIYEDEPLGFEKDPLSSNPKM
jgi:hypothetical protein